MTSQAKVTFSETLSIAEQPESVESQNSILQHSNLQETILHQNRGLELQTQYIQLIAMGHLPEYQFTFFENQGHFHQAGSKKQQKKGLSLNHRKMLKNLKMQKSSQLCSICIMPFVKDQIIKKIPCSHIFHRKCIKPWLKIDHTCPMCRYDIEQHFQKENKDAKLKQMKTVNNREQLSDLLNYD